MSRRVRRLAPLGIAVGLAVSAALRAQSAPATPDSPQPRRVLFVGNSLTYWNDLPEIVAAFGQAGGPPALFCRAVVGGGYSLEDHWREGDARKVLAEGGWDFVVLQQGPSASRDGRLSLLQWTRRFAEEIRRVGGRPALYMVWPARNRPEDFEGVAASYRQAARDVGGLLLPAGEAWRIAWGLDPKLELYSSDGLHPSPAGSYAAALVLYAGLTGRSPIGLPATVALSSGRLALPEEEAKILQKAAAEAVEH